MDYKFPPLKTELVFEYGIIMSRGIT